jgi:hypothetical protein
MRLSSIRSAVVLSALCFASAVACGDDDDGRAGPSAGSGAGGAAGAGREDGGAGLGGSSGETGVAGGGVSEPQSVTIRFKATVGNAEFACGQVYDNQGTASTTIVPRDLRFFVEGVRLVDVQGREVPVVLDERAPFQSQEVALLDFEDGSAACINGNAELNSTITATVAPGHYVGIVFSTAVPQELNHADPTTLPAPLQAGGLSWGWLFGYRFLVAEVVSEPQYRGEGGTGGEGVGGRHSGGDGGADHTVGEGGADPGHGPSMPGGLFHLGSVECTSSEEPDFNAPPTTDCAKQFRNEIRLDGFNPADNVIVADVGALFSAVDLSSDSTCHSFAGAACPALFGAVGLDYTTGDRTEGQTFFRVEK